MFGLPGAKPSIQDGEHRVYAGSVALFTNFLPPYRIRLLELLQDSLGKLRIFLSIAMEQNRKWQPDWGMLDVTLQHSVALPGRVADPGLYVEHSTVHVPYDTLWQLARCRPDVIISAEFGMRTAQASIYKFLRPRTALIVWATLSEETEKPRGTARMILRRAILRVSDAVLVNGNSGRRYIEGLGFSHNRIHIVPQASDNERFRGAATRDQDKVLKLLYAGQLIERKGLREFYAALSAWCKLYPNRQIRWTLVGSGPLRSIIESWTCPANLRVEVLADVPYAEVAQYFHRADLFVLPSLADEWGLVVNEALIAGLPVLGSIYSQAVEDLVFDGVNGWVFRSDRSEEIHAAIDAAFGCSQEQLNKMRAAAIASVEKLDFHFMQARMLTAIYAAVNRSTQERRA